MIAAIVGSRTATPAHVFDAMNNCPFTALIDFVVSGGAQGADKFGIEWARARHIPFREILADWRNINAPGAVVRKSKKGVPYNLLAGYWRNQEVAELIAREQGYMVAVWDCSSGGTQDVLKRARTSGVPEERIYVHKFVVNVPKFRQHKLQNFR